MVVKGWQFASTVLHLPLMKGKSVRKSLTTLSSTLGLRSDQKPRLMIASPLFFKGLILGFFILILHVAPSYADANTSTIFLDNGNHRLTFNSKTGQLMSLRASQAMDQEFIFPHDDDPVFVVQYLDDKHFFHQVTSKQAARIEIKPSSESEHILVVQFQALGGLELNANVTIRVVPGDPDEPAVEGGEKAPASIAGRSCGRAALAHRARAQAPTEREREAERQKETSQPRATDSW